MKKKNILSLFSLRSATLILFASCRIQTTGEYETLLGANPLSLFHQMRIIELLNTTTALFSLSILSGLLIFILGMLFYFLHKKDQSFLYLSLSSLGGALIFSTPLWAGKIELPAEFWSPSLVRTVFLLLYYFLFRIWGRKALYHRTKAWSYVTTTVLLSITLIGTVLSGHFPGLTSIQWPVPLLASLLILDTLINSILSFQRKNDRSGVAGVLMTLPIAAGTAWILMTRGYSTLLPFLNHLYYILPALMIPWQLILTISLIQRRYFTEEQRTAILSKMVEDEELQKNKLEELIEKLEERIEEAVRIPDYTLECARKVLAYTTPLPLNLPDSWKGEHRIVADPGAKPVLGAWNKGRTLLFSEGTDKNALLPLIYLKECFDGLKMDKPAQLLKTLNESMISLPYNMEKSLNATLLYFMDDELICGTAGDVRVYIQNSEGRIIPVRGEDKPVTYREGLGVRPTTREDGKPFRITLSRGDRIVLVSCSLTDREMEGEKYGQKSLYRVLRSHASGDPQNTVQAILKDYDDFDLGNTPDRQIYVGVFAKI